MLEIIEREHYHELLLSVKNLQNLGANPFPYIVPVLPRPLPREVVKGEYFVLADLLKSLPRGSTQERPLVLPDCPPLAVQNPKPAPEEVTKKKKKSGPTKDWRGSWTRRIQQLANRLKRERLKCLVSSLGLLHG